MKKTRILLSFIIVIGLITLVESCDSKREPGKVYMPDMAYSRAYEAYAPNNLAKENINYNPAPVEGTIRRGDLFPYNLPDDSTGYRLSAQVKDPLPPLDSVQMKEAGRLFNINCAICHGPNLNAQGPLATGGKIPAVANLTLAVYVKMPVGTMFHSITYGKNNMGSYASQLTREQRWMVIQYVKSRQAELSAGTESATGDSTTTTK
ncbi:MAG: cytochrome c [Bacteroidota bacterium]|jgi:mono/diheme cytochrome c family protein|nr:cytochrome c [Bacteroidota bacterium]